MGEQRARVTAAYATVPVLDTPSGKPTVYGFHQGAVFPPSSDPEAVARLVRRGYAEWVQEDEPAAAEEPAPADTDADAGLSTEPSTATTATGDRPTQADPKSAWVDYVVSAYGVIRSTAEAMTKADLIATYGVW